MTSMPYLLPLAEGLEGIFWIIVILASIASQIAKATKRSKARELPQAAASPTAPRSIDRPPPASPEDELRAFIESLRGTQPKPPSPTPPTPPPRPHAAPPRAHAAQPHPAASPHHAKSWARSSPRKTPQPARRLATSFPSPPRRTGRPPRLARIPVRTEPAAPVAAKPKRYKSKADRAAHATQVPSAYDMRDRIPAVRSEVVALLSKRRTLRDAFVLHELLSPPVCMRDPSARHGGAAA